jgi:hypothetical protein
MQTDREAFMEFTKGATFVLTVFAVFALVVALLSNAKQEPTEKFKVVDSYGSCDVVRYTDSSNRYNYFLHCK